ncbi:beta-ketoacyl synthase N-terminal-like domain-containing protein, partial [Priestia megaterium]
MKSIIDSNNIFEIDFSHSKLERYLRLLLLDAFQRMGVFQQDGEQYEKEILQSQLGILPQYSRLFVALLDILERAGIIQYSGRYILYKGEIESVLQKKSSIIQERGTQLRKEFPELGAYVQLLDVCLKHYPDILRGNVPATDIIFPNSSMDLVQGIYKGNQSADYYNELMAQSVLSYIQVRLPLLKENEKINILEIGAGTGGTSAFIFDAIRMYSDKINYMYTDISYRFIEYGKEHFGNDNPFVNFKVLDIEKDVHSQGIDAGEYDIVLAANVLHATRNIRATLSHAKGLLKKHGWLVINEITNRFDYLTMTFGLLEGWWLYEDGEDRIANSPLFTWERWETILKQEGFEKSIAIKNSNSYRDNKQNVIIAESNGEVKKQQKEEKTKNSLHLDQSLNQEKSIVPNLSNQNVITDSANKDEELDQYIRESIVTTISTLLHIDENEFDLETPYSDFGIDSILAVEVINLINNKLDIELRSTDLFNHATIEKLKEYIINEFGEKVIYKLDSQLYSGITKEKSENTFHYENEFEEKEDVQIALSSKEDLSSKENRKDKSHYIAIVGISGRFPDAKNVKEFWDNLKKGKDSVKEINRWDMDAFYHPVPQTPGKSYSKWGGFLSDVGMFDPLFFNISPKEAEFMDPQQRLFLEEAWKAIEDAGYSNVELKGKKCGVFVGCAPGDYRRKMGEYNISPEAYSFMGNNEAILASRISYLLNLKGPSISINTACSSSLVALHLACESIHNRTSEMALAGGVSIMNTPDSYILASQAGMLSADGRCRAFDQRANGFVPSEGVGVVMLKSLEAALEDGDHVYGVITGSGINQDGKTNGITAPSAPSQTALEQEVYDRYEINPETISYVETHGTGTKLGDPIEIDALTDGFRKYTTQTQYCAVGSVKTNIGHTLAAAGVAGLIKVLLCMKYQTLVPSIHY